MNHQNIIKIKEEELWDFTLKEICKNLNCSKFDFVMDMKRYKSFRRRFEYFLRKIKQKGEELLK